MVVCWFVGFIGCWLMLVPGSIVSIAFGLMMVVWCSIAMVMIWWVGTAIARCVGSRRCLLVLWCSACSDRSTCVC